MESLNSRKRARTQIARPSRTIPGQGRDLEGVRITRPPNELLRNDAMGILGPNHSVDLIAAHGIRDGAGATLQVMDHARGGRVRALAERAGNVLAAMEA